VYVKHQYLGFLSSTSLEEAASLLHLELFDFEELSRNTSEIKNINLELRANEVLGKRIEHFFEYCLQTSNRYHVIAKNIQIFKDKITIGEIDFIIKDLEKEIITHIELVYKFYLYDPQIQTEQDRWIGPNRNDSLVQKLNKLKNQQFPLLQQKETVKELKKLQLKPKKITQQVCYLANLFLPVSYKEKNMDISNSNCVKGYWITQKDFTITQYGAYLFFIPKKQDWVTDPKHNNQWFSFNQIQEDLQSLLVQKKSPLVWIKKKRDYERIFLVWW